MRDLEAAVDTDAVAPAEPQSVEPSVTAPDAPTTLDLAAARSRAWLMNRVLRTINANIEFTVHESSGEIVVELIDKASNETLRYLPVEVFPDVAAVLDRQQGVLISDSA
jgi:hypothetical protein